VHLLGCMYPRFGVSYHWKYRPPQHGSQILMAAPKVVTKYMGMGLHELHEPGVSWLLVGEEGQKLRRFPLFSRRASWCQLATSRTFFDNDLQEGSGKSLGLGVEVASGLVAKTWAGTLALWQNSTLE
jgi:hypothetical protein